MKTQQLKAFYCSKNSSKKEVYTILPQEARKILNRLFNFTLKTTGERMKKTHSRRKEIIKIQAEINEKEMKETIVKINKTKSWFFEKINTIDKLLDRLIQKKKKKGGGWGAKNKINKIRSEKGEVTIDNTEIQRIIRTYQKQLYANKMDKL